MSGRRIYEDGADLSKEDRIKQFLERKYGVVMEKLPIKYGADYLAFRDGKPVSFIEIKCRTNPKDKYDTYMLSLHKFVIVGLFREVLRIPFFLYVKWTDAFGFIDASKCTYTVGMQKANFRNDKDDIEPCIFIPVSGFTLINDIGAKAGTPDRVPLNLGE